MPRPRPACRCRRAPSRCRRTPRSRAGRRRRPSSVDTEVLEWIASQMRGKRRSNRTLMTMVATVVGAAALPLAQLPGRAGHGNAVGSSGDIGFLGGGVAPAVFRLYAATLIIPPTQPSASSSIPEQAGNPVRRGFSVHH